MSPESADAASSVSSSSSASGSSESAGDLTGRSASSSSTAKANVAVKSTVNDYSWEELSAISRELSACKSFDDAVKIAASYNLCSASGELDGSQVKDVVLSNGVTVQARIVNLLSHYSDDRLGDCGLTFMFTSCVDARQMNATDTTQGGWKETELNKWLNSEFVTWLPSDLSKVIETVRVGYSDPEHAASQSKATGCKLFIPAAVELTGAWTEEDAGSQVLATYVSQEGHQFRYFKALDVKKRSVEGQDVVNPELLLPLSHMSDSKLAETGVYQVGEPCMWWLRTAYTGEQFFCVAPNGVPRGALEAGLWAGVVPCFCV